VVNPRALGGKGGDLGGDGGASRHNGRIEIGELCQGGVRLQGNDASGLNLGRDGGDAGACLGGLNLGPCLALFRGWRIGDKLNGSGNEV
jgi:hypothetical protein